MFWLRLESADEFELDVSKQLSNYVNAQVMSETSAYFSQLTVLLIGRFGPAMFYAIIFSTIQRSTC